MRTVMGQEAHGREGTALPKAHCWERGPASGRHKKPSRVSETFIPQVPVSCSDDTCFSPHTHGTQTAKRRDS